MWTDAKLADNIYSFKATDKDGRIQMYIERPSIGSANLEYFTIIIKDKDEKELYRETLEQDIPETPNSNDMWWNLGYAYPNIKLTPPFYIYVVDRLEDAPFKFEVTAVK